MQLYKGRFDWVQCYLQVVGNLETLQGKWHMQLQMLLRGMPDRLATAVQPSWGCGVLAGVCVAWLLLEDVSVSCLPSVCCHDGGRLVAMGAGSSPMGVSVPGASGVVFGRKLAAIWPGSLSGLLSC